MHSLSCVRRPADDDDDDDCDENEDGDVIWVSEHPHRGLVDHTAATRVDRHSIRSPLSLNEYHETDRQVSK